MNHKALQQQITYRLDQMNELNSKMNSHAGSIPQVEIDDLLHQIRQLYEATLLLNQHNSLKTMEEMEIAVAEKFRGFPENGIPAESKKEAAPAREPVSATPVEKVHALENTLVPEKPVTTERVMVETGNKAREEKIAVSASVNRKGTTDLHEQFEEIPNLAGQFKDQETLGERIATSQPSKRVAENLKNAPIHDLKQAIGINEKFQFINHLFGGDSRTYHSAIDHLNSCTTLSAAKDYVNSALIPHYHWNKESAPAGLFMEILSRRFPA